MKVTARVRMTVDIEIKQPYGQSATAENIFIEARRTAEDAIQSHNRFVRVGTDIPPSPLNARVIGQPVVMAIFAAEDEFDA